MLWEDEERTRDVSNIVKSLIPPPVGMSTTYYPGEGGFATRDLTQPAGPSGPGPTSAVDINAPGGPQSRLSQLESNPTNVPTSGYGQLDLGGRSYSMPSAAIAEAVNAGTGGGTSMGAPKYGIPDEMMTRFDDVIKAITGPSDATDLIKMQAQGFGLGMGGRRIPGGGYEPNPRLAASAALANIEGVKRQAISHVANALSNLMMDPNKFAQEIYGTQMRSASESERNRLLGRQTAVDETLLPYKMRETMMKAPQTVAGYGPGGEHILSGWDPDKQTWTTISKGAVPVGIPEGGTLVNPITGEVISKGEEKKQTQGRLAQLSWKSYEDELKAIHDPNNLEFAITQKLKPDEVEKRKQAKAKAEMSAWNTLAIKMEKLGYGDMFKAMNQTPTEGQTRPGQFGNYIYRNGKWEIYEAANAIPIRKPNETIDEYLKRAGL